MLKKKKPITPGLRRATFDTFGDITKKKPEKKLTLAKKRKAGRGYKGRVTIRHRGGGAKRRIRIIDYKRNKFDQEAEVKSIEYDPNRGARIALVQYKDNEKRYIIAPINLKVGQKILSSRDKIDFNLGNAMPLKYIPVGMTVYNIELEPGKGGQIVRGAGTGAKLMAVEGKYAQLKLPSGEIRLILKNCLATIGQVSNPDRKHIKLGKAGRKRYLGIRPTVRGKAMNPVDHPHGGGEGKQPIGLKGPKTPWGKPALGVKTRKKHKKSNKFILQRRKTKRR